MSALAYIRGTVVEYDGQRCVVQRESFNDTVVLSRFDYRGVAEQTTLETEVCRVSPTTEYAVMRLVVVRGTKQPRYTLQ